MAQHLYEKPRGDAVGVTIGDFATTEVGGGFALAYLAFNTVMNLITQPAQVACFQNVARQLDAGGRFVIEVITPPLQSAPRGETFRVFDGSEDYWSFDEIDVANQGLISHHFRCADDGFGLNSTPFHYVWPAALDLMAQLAVMELRER
jgi:hypothetical protein